MAIETEAKMAVDSLEVVRTRVVERGGKLLARYLETNTFFDTEDRSLLAADKGLRLRLKHNRDTNEEHFVLTFKGPRQPGALKTREEIEVMVEGSAEAVRLLECLGYRKVLMFEKRRDSYDLDGCEVELDELPHLGTFVEIEGPDQDCVMRVRQNLGLGDRPLIKVGYVSLLAGYLQERGQQQREVRFG